ncbi:MAG: SGNH/GDSL hydrolase family protein [Candidatus Omnitrophota bacterium]|nr:SGNH/GDSL hydrolase family protein [Candidatus Omnitrophota bacterium]
MASRRVLKVLTWLLFMIVLVESSSQLLYRFRYGVWRFKGDPVNYMTFFEWHPWLVGSPQPGVSFSAGDVTISHNSLGFRGPEFNLHKNPAKKRVVVYGGSSTYGVNVSDSDTWSSYLQQELGPSYEVVNAGVPGYSTAEAVIQTALQQMDLDADIAVYYQGWNDIRNSHVEGLKSDYSSFHGPSQIGSLGLNRIKWAYRSAFAAIMGRFMERVTAKKSFLKQRGKTQPGVDSRALSIYKYNLQTLAGLAALRGTQAVMIPQVLNYAVLTSDKPYGAWIPYIADKDIKEVMGAYNKAMSEVCSEENLTCVSSVLAEDWRAGDFVDEGHFSIEGTKKFARLVADAVKESQSA